MRRKPLFPDQEVGVNEILKALRAGWKRPVFKLPTGGGKTVIAAEIILRAREKGNRVAFVVDAISLIEQSVERFIEAGIPSEDIGVLQGLHERTDITRPVQIISIDTLRARPGILTIPEFADKLKLVLVDECHCQKSFLYDWMARWNAVTFIGLSATPWAKGMAKHWDTLVVGGTLRDMIANGRLSQYKVYAAASPDLSKVKSNSKDFNEVDLAKAMTDGALVGDSVRHWKKHAQDRPTLTFCVNRIHAMAVQKEFEAHHVPTGYIDAYTPLEEREEIGRKLARGELKNVVSVGCLTKGVDWDVRCILLLRPTKSEMLFIQIVGRGLRTAEGKDYCLILDHSDTFLRLGFPEDIDLAHDELNDGNKPENSERMIEEPKPTKCSNCGYVKPPKIHACPSCGFAPERIYQGDTVTAELTELVPKEKERINRVTKPEEKAAFYSGLKHYGAGKGYKPGWAANQYREKFGVWPNKYKDVKPTPPNEMVKGWIRHNAIKRRYQAA